MKRSEFLLYLDKLLTPELFEDYAPNGLQVEGSEDIEKVAFAVSATKESLEEAITWGAQALVVHHGIFWKHQGARTITGAWGKRVSLAVLNNLNLFAYHLPLDSHPEVGNAVALGRQIGLTNPGPFGLHKKRPLGIKGELSPLSAAELRVKLKSILKHEVILASPDDSRTIKNIGIITGGANNEWAEALNENLDAYLTGEISEYNWHDAKEAGIHYFAGGHHSTERFGIQALMDKVQVDLKVEVKFFDSTNPA